MVLKKILLAFSPPGIGLVVWEKNGEVIKHFDLSELNVFSDTLCITNKILLNESSDIIQHKNLINNGILKIQEKLKERDSFNKKDFSFQHYLPITNIALNNSGEKCITASYDRTAKIWDLNNEEDVIILEGHNCVVFSVAFNKNSDKILTGSFDKTAKLWDVINGKDLQTYWGHTEEIIIAKFLYNDETIATASTDASIRIFQTDTGQESKIFVGHQDDIVSMEINKEGFIISGSFDKTIRIWDPRTASCVHVLCGHEGVISSCKLNQDSTMLVSGSFDGKTIVWDLKMMKYFKIFSNTTSEKHKILDVDIKETKVASATSTGAAYIWDTLDESLHWDLLGHEKPIPKLCFNHAKNEIMTCSEDKSLRVWNLENFGCSPYILEHNSSVYSGTFLPCGNKIISVCGDNSCKIWYRK